jgi:hypothetical protein
MASICRAALATLALALACSAAQADLSISNKPTQNMSCDAGVCTATAQKAVLNVSDLKNMLGAGDLTVTTGTAAKDIRVSAPLSWSRGSQLILDARRLIVFQQPISVTGKGGITIYTKYGKTGGYFWFEKKGRLEFWDLRSNLVINHKKYTLVSTVKELATAVSNNSNGFYALAADYDAAQDGAYAHSPVPQFYGVFEGLGNTIANVDIETSDSNANIGFFEKAGGLLRDVNLTDLKISAQGSNNLIGGIAGSGNDVSYSSVTGSIAGTGGFIGGLVGGDLGNIRYSHTSVNITGLTGSAGGLIGDLEGENVFQSYALGSVNADNAGGLIADLGRGFVTYSYAKGDVTGNNNAGGLIGIKDHVFVGNSFATGLVSGGSGSCIGGYSAVDFGFDLNSYNYWDIDTSGTDQATCYGAVPGVAGLTTEQFKAGLPEGFDPHVWGQAPNINNGYPYLRANPPQ